jgi:nitrogen fixation protein FixH
MTSQPVTLQMTIQPDRSQLQQMERRARNFWVSGIVGLLGLQVLGGVAAVLLSSGDPSVAIVPNYHRAALDWDMTHREQHLLDRLAWRIETEIGLLNVEGRRQVVVSIFDDQMAPVGGVRLTARLYHHSRGGQVDTVHFRETSEGQYESQTALQKRGLWQVDIKIEGDHGIALHSQEMEVL